MTATGSGRGARVGVALRARPPIAEDDLGDVKGATACHADLRKKADYDKFLNSVYQFDTVHEEHSSQADVYSGSIEPLVNTFLAGGTVAVLAYGSRGSGKTFTLVGDQHLEENKGVVRRSVEAVLRSVEALKDQDVRLWATFTALSKGSDSRVYDLLASCQDPMPLGSPTSTCEIRSAVDIEHVLSFAKNATGSLHTQLTLGIEAPGDTSHKATAVFVELAAPPGAQGAAGGVGEEHHAQSYAGLESVLESLSKPGNGVVPWEDFCSLPLVFWLRPALDGAEAVLVLATVCLSLSSIADTGATLKWASRFRQGPGVVIAPRVESTAPPEIDRKEEQRFPEVVNLKLPTSANDMSVAGDAFAVRQLGRERARAEAAEVRAAKAEAEAAKASAEARALRSELRTARFDGRRLEEDLEQAERRVGQAQALAAAAREESEMAHEQRNTLATQLAERVKELSAAAGELRSKAAAASERAEREAFARAEAELRAGALERRIDDAERRARSSRRGTDRQPDSRSPSPPSVATRAELRALRERLAAADATRDAAEDAAAAAQGRAEASEALASRGAKVARDLKRQLVEESDRCRAALKAKEDCEARLAACLDDLQDSEMRQEGMEQALSSSMAALEGLKLRLQEHTEKSDSLEAMVKNLTEECEGLVMSAQELEAQASELRNAKARLEDTNATLSNSNDIQRSLVSSLRAQLAAAEGRGEGAVAAVSSIEEELDEEQFRRGRLQAQLVEVEQALADERQRRAVDAARASEELEEARAAARRLAADAEEARVKADGLAAEADEARREQGKSERDREREVSVLEAKMRDAQDAMQRALDETKSLRVSEQEAQLEAERSAQAQQTAVRDRDAVVRHMEEAKKAARLAKKEAAALQGALEAACTAVSGVWAELSQASKAAEDVVNSMRGSGAVVDAKGTAAMAVVDWAERLHMDQLLRAATEMRGEVWNGREEARQLRKEAKEARRAAAESQRALSDLRKRADEDAERAADRHKRELEDLKAARVAEVKELKAAKKLSETELQSRRTAEVAEVRRRWEEEVLELKAKAAQEAEQALATGMSRAAEAQARKDLEVDEVRQEAALALEAARAELEAAEKQSMEALQALRERAAAELRDSRLELEREADAREAAARAEAAEEAAKKAEAHQKEVLTLAAEVCEVQEAANAREKAGRDALEASEANHTTQLKQLRDANEKELESVHDGWRREVSELRSALEQARTDLAHASRAWEAEVAARARDLSEVQAAWEAEASRERLKKEAELERLRVEGAAEVEGLRDAWAREAEDWRREASEQRAQSSVEVEKLRAEAIRRAEETQETAKRAEERLGLLHKEELAKVAAEAGIERASERAEFAAELQRIGDEARRMEEDAQAERRSAADAAIRAQASLDELQAKYEDAKASSAASAAAAEELREAAAELRNLRQEAEMRQASAEAQAAKMAEDSKVIMAELSEARKELRDLSAELAGSKADLQESKKHLTLTQHELREKDAKLSNAEEALKSATQEIIRIEALVRERSHELDAARTTAKSNADNAEASRQEATASQVLARDASEMLQVTEVRMEALRAEATHVQEAHAVAVEELNRRLDAAEATAAKLPKVEGAARERKAALAKAEVNIASLKQTVKEQEGEIRSASKQATVLSRERDAAEIKLNDLEEICKTLTLEKERLQDKLSAAEAQISGLQIQVAVADARQRAMVNCDIDSSDFISARRRSPPRSPQQSVTSFTPRPMDRCPRSSPPVRQRAERQPATRADDRRNPYLDDLGLPQNYHSTLILTPAGALMTASDTHCVPARTAEIHTEKAENSQTSPNTAGGAGTNMESPRAQAGHAPHNEQHRADGPGHDDDMTTLSRNFMQLASSTPPPSPPTTVQYNVQSIIADHVPSAEAMSAQTISKTCDYRSSDSSEQSSGTFSDTSSRHARNDYAAKKCEVPTSSPTSSSSERSAADGASKDGEHPLDASLGSAGLDWDDLVKDPSWLSAGRSTSSDA